MNSTNSWSLPLGISLGAIAGALSRYYLQLWLGNSWGTAFPLGILVFNLSGCWLMGLVYGFTAQGSTPFSPAVYMALTTGFLGAYTTFSTYGLDTIKLLEKNLWWGLAYGCGSAVAGVLNVRLGIIMAAWFAK
jgi:fluoride exporter